MQIIKKYRRYAPVARERDQIEMRIRRYVLVLAGIEFRLRNCIFLSSSSSSFAPAWSSFDRFIARGWGARRE